MSSSRLNALALAIPVLVACSDSSDRSGNSTPTPPVEEFTYEATVTRTEYGIPHIVADDWGGLG